MADQAGSAGGPQSTRGRSLKALAKELKDQGYDERHNPLKASHASKKKKKPTGSEEGQGRKNRLLTEDLQVALEGYGIRLSNPGSLVVP